MTICPIAIAVGCKKCPAFKFCPLTTVLGDQGVGARGWNYPSDVYVFHAEYVAGKSKLFHKLLHQTVETLKKFNR
jgi:hypothetical protein